MSSMDGTEQRGVAELRTLGRIVVALTRPARLQDRLEESLDELLLLTGFDIGLVCLKQDDGALRLAAQRHLPLEALLALTEGTPCRVCPPAGAPCDTLGEAHRETFPICVRDRQLGLICLFSHNARCPDEHQRRLLETVAAHVGVAVENIQLLEQTRRQITTLEQEIGERQRAEEALRVSEGRYRALVETAPYSIVGCDMQGKIVVCNEQAARAHGFDSREQLLGTDAFALVAPWDRERMGQQTQRLLDCGAYTNVEFDLVRRDGSSFPAEVSSAVIRDSQGQPTNLVGSMWNIAERKRHEALLGVLANSATTFLESGDVPQALTLLLRHAVQQTGSELGFVAAVTEGPVLRVVAHEGIKWHAAINREFFESALRAYAEQGYLEFRQMNSLYGAVLTTGEIVISNDPAQDARAYGVPAGHPPLQSFFGVPLRRGEIVGVMGLANRPGGYTAADQHAISPLTPQAALLCDSYLRALREQALRCRIEQAERLESVGRLAGSVAHDFNNLLAGIIGCTELFERKAARGQVDLAELREVRRSADRAVTLTSELLAFARQQVLSPQRLDLSAVVRQAEHLLRHLLGERVVLHLLLAQDLLPIRADAAQLERVVMNLAINARDAMPDGGTLVIRTSHSPSAEGMRVCLSVADTGQGMSQATLSHIFEPFFTTKAPGKGTGLGLSTVYGIVKQSEGDIDVQSTLGRGTTFRLFFPAIEPERNATALSVSPANP